MEQQAKFCHSCGVPLDGKMGKEVVENYCHFCTDENGKLKPREVVRVQLLNG